MVCVVQSDPQLLIVTPVRDIQRFLCERKNRVCGDFVLQQGTPDIGGMVVCEYLTGVDDARHDLLDRSMVMTLRVFICTRKLGPSTDGFVSDFMGSG